MLGTSQNWKKIKRKKKGKKELTKGSKFDIISKPTVAGGHGGRGKAP